MNLSKELLPKEFDAAMPVYALIIPFADNGVTSDRGKLFQVKYINSNGFYYTTIGVMSMQVFDLIAVIVYIPDVKLPF